MFRAFYSFCLAALLQLISPVAFAQTAETANPPSGLAKVVFYRSSQDSGGKSYALTSQNQQLVKLKKGEKFEQVLVPGTYYYMADPNTKQVFKLELIAGQTYYVRAASEDDYFDGKPTLRLSTVQDYQQNLARTN